MSQFAYKVVMIRDRQLVSSFIRGDLMVNYRKDEVIHADAEMDKHGYGLYVYDNEQTALRCGCAGVSEVWKVEVTNVRNPPKTISPTTRAYKQNILTILENGGKLGIDATYYINVENVKVVSSLKFIERIG